MISNWTEKKLGDLITLKRGYDLPKSKRLNGEVPIMSSSGINGTHNEFKAKGPGVITGRSGQLGKVFYCEHDFWPLNTTLYVEDFKDSDPKFIYYFLQTLNFEQFNAGSSVPTLNRNHVHLLEIKVPTYNIQQKIGTILYMLEQKIQTNLDIISNLEQLSQTLFKHWFIDFEYPNEQGQLYKSSGGEMVESELGEIPKGWKISTIDSIGTIIGGGTPAKKHDEYYTDNGISWITPKDLSNDSSTYIYNGAIDITELGLKKGSARLLPKDTVLFSSRAPIGYIAIAGQEVTTNQGFKSIVPNKGYCSYFIYHLLKYRLPTIEAAAGGSTFKEISGKGLKEISIILPDLNVVNNYKEIVEPLFLQIQSLEKENNNLTQLRDTLLPKLLSGEIEIPDELEV